MKSKNNADLISVIIPTYNRRDKAEKAIKSVLAQTYESFELVVVDDGSTDGTADMVRSLNDSRIVLIEFPQNRGVNAARNVGMERATGIWIVFLDSDDYFFPFALEKFYEYIEKAPESVGIMRFNAINSETGEVMGFQPNDKNWETKIFSYEDFLSAPSEADHYISIRPETLECGVRHPEWINGYESLFYHGVLKYWDLMYVNHVIGVYDRDDAPDHISDDRELKQPGPYARVFATYLENHQDLLDRYPNKKARLIARIGLCNGYQGKRVEGLKWLFRGIKHRPSRFWYPIKVAFLPIIFGKKSIEIRQTLRPFYLKVAKAFR